VVLNEFNFVYSKNYLKFVNNFNYFHFPQKEAKVLIIAPKFTIVFFLDKKTSQKIF